MKNLTHFTETKEGLRIELNTTPSAQEDIQEVRENLESGKWGYHDAFWELCESPLCNGYSMVRPELIGALTDAPIISDGIFDEETTKEEANNSKIWWFPDYMVRDELRELLDKGFVIFTQTQ
jgi:hypothetical protein